LRVGDPQALLRLLAARRIQVSPRQGAIRVALHAFNTESDLDMFCATMVAARDGLLA
jgi:selenocysteine lyase/cysteine desulfurase